MFKWLRASNNEAVKAPTGSLLMQLLGARGRRRIAITADNATTISAVYNALTLYCNSVSKLPLIVYERTKDGGKSRATNSALYRCLHRRPNGRMTPFEFKETIVAHLILRGNFYAYINSNTVDGRFRFELLPINPDDVDLYYNEKSSRLVYKIRAKSGHEWFSSDEILHVKGPFSDGFKGKSVIEAAAESLGRAKGYEEFANDLVENGITVPGALTYPKKLNDEDYDRLQSKFQERYATPGERHKPMLLEHGIEWKQLGISPKDAEFLESRKFEIEEIARWMNLPPHKLKDLSRATFSNIEHQALEFWQDSIEPYTKRIEEAITLAFFGEDESKFCEFMFDAIHLADILTRYQAHRIALMDGWKNRNEVRAIENLNRQEGLDEFLVQANMGQNNPQTIAGAPKEEKKSDISPLIARDIDRLCTLASKKSAQFAEKQADNGAFREFLVGEFEDKAQLWMGGYRSYVTDFDAKMDKLTALFRASVDEFGASEADPASMHRLSGNYSSLDSLKMAQSIF